MCCWRISRFTVFQTILGFFYDKAFRKNDAFVVLIVFKVHFLLLDKFCGPFHFYNHGHKYWLKCETQASFSYFYRRKNDLISSGKSNGVKIRIWSKSLGTKLLRTTGFIKIP